MILWRALSPPHAFLPVIPRQRSAVQYSSAAIRIPCAASYDPSPQWLPPRQTGAAISHAQHRGVALDVHFASPVPVERHARVGGHPVPMPLASWIPAFAGMTRGYQNWQCIYETDI